MPSFPPAIRRLSRISLHPLFAIALFLAGLTRVTAITGAPVDDKPHFGPAPAWALPGEWKTPATVQANPTGQDYLLVDEQARLATGESYRHNVYQIVSDHGREGGSQVYFYFDPSYQTLTIHHIDLIRDGKKTNRLVPEKIQVLQQERDLDRQMYNGLRSALAILEDVRVGDIVDIAYSLAGRNPVFGETFIDTAAVGWGTPVQFQRYRLLVPEGRRVTAKLMATAPDLVTTHATTGGEQDLAWTRRDVPILESEDRVPGSEYTYPFLDFSEYPSWKEVVHWALPLYAADPAPSPELDALVARLKAGDTSPEQQVLDALTFVQQEVRYLGIEMGTGSHRPSAPEEVLRRRFGDCKDKTRLLCAILTRLGHQAAPALVQSYRREATYQRLPTPYAFDHVIVALEWNKQRYLLDPTLSYQRGEGLALRHVGRYGPYLRVAPQAANRLEDATYGIGDLQDILVEEELSCPSFDRPTVMTVTTTAQGRAAENLRAYFATSTLDQIGRSYLDYYTRYYTGITRQSPVEFTDSPRTNTFKVTEHYQIDRWFAHTDTDPTKRAEMNPATIWDYVRTPNLAQRNLPYSLSHPVKVRERITAHLPDDWGLTPEKQLIEDKAFKLRFEVEQPNPRTLVLDHVWESRADRIEPARLEEFSAHMKKARDQLGYTLTWKDAPTVAAIKNWSGPGLNWPLVLIGLFVGVAGTAASCVLILRRNPKPPAPVTPAAPDAPTAPADPYSYKARQAEEPVGLGGWLILIGFGLVVRPFMWIYKLVESRNAYFDQATWDSVTQKAGEHYAPNFQYVAPVEMMLGVFLLVYSVLLAVLFFRRSHLFPRLMQAYLVMAVGYVLFLAWGASLLGQTPGMEEYAPVVQTAIAAAIWIPYFATSRRVKATFTR